MVGRERAIVVDEQMGGVDFSGEEAQALSAFVDQCDSDDPDFGFDFLGEFEVSVDEWQFAAAAMAAADRGSVLGVYKAEALNHELLTSDQERGYAWDILRGEKFAERLGEGFELIGKYGRGEVEEKDLKSTHRKILAFLALASKLRSEVSGVDSDKVFESFFAELDVSTSDCEKLERQLAQMHDFADEMQLLESDEWVDQIPVSDEQVEAARLAREAFVVHNARLVFNIAVRRVGQGLPLADLIQAGNLGLLEAIDRYDGVSNRFSTVATWWIQKMIGREVIDTARMVRLPDYLTQRINKLNKIHKRFEVEEGRQATIQELAEELKEDVATIEEWILASRHVVYLDRVKRGGSEEGETLGELLVGDDDEEWSAGMDRQIFFERLSKVLDGFSEEYRRLVIMRLGLDGREPVALVQVGRELGVSRSIVNRMWREVQSALAEALGDLVE